MANNDIPLSSANHMTSISYAGLINQCRRQDDDFYENVRLRFLKQSASYLGADLNNSAIESIYSTSHNNIEAARK